MTNITYVSYLFSSADDKVSMADRVELIKPLLNINAFLILFVDVIDHSLTIISPEYD